MPWPVTSAMTSEEAAVGELLPVVVVAAGLVGGGVHAGDVKAGELGGAGGEEAGLDLAGDFEVAFDGGELQAGACSRASASSTASWT